mgnify:CR=1 FL=1
MKVSVSKGKMNLKFLKMRTITFLFFISFLSFENLSANEISNSEKEGIILMREEEKLAHDVYRFLYEKWGLNIFSNISESETRHFNAMAYLIEDFNLADPALKEPGKFQNKELQFLYDSLTNRGSESVIAALQTGAFIEELDIQDLQQLMGETENATILSVFQNLLRASGNHLRAFTGQLASRDYEYSPSVLPASNYQSVIETPHQRGMGNGNCKNQNNCRNNRPDGKRYRGGRGNN